MGRAAASRAESDARTLDELEYHWGSAYHIAVTGGAWTARRRDGKGGTLTDALPEGLRLRIVADYDADPADPAAQAYRARIRARYAEMYDERTKTETKLTAVETAAQPDNDPALLDTLPIAAAVLVGAPDRIKEALLAAFDIQALYNKDMDQVTIWATLTEDTPRTIAALVNDPRPTATPTTPPQPLPRALFHI